MRFNHVARIIVARVLVRFSHVASIAVNADHDIAAVSQQSNWHRGDRTTVCDPLTLLVAACGVCAACDGFGFARNTTATFDVFYWL